VAVVTDDSMHWARAHVAASVGAGAAFVWLVVGASWWCCKPDAKAIAQTMVAEQAEQDEALQLVLQRGVPRSAASMQQQQQHFQQHFQPGDVFVGEERAYGSYAHGDDDI